MKKKLSKIKIKNNKNTKQNIAKLTILQQWPKVKISREEKTKREERQQ